MVEQTVAPAVAALHVDAPGLQDPRASRIGKQETANRAPPKRRGRYVSRACQVCQRRKVKCSGQHPCDNCLYTNSQCIYVGGRFRKPRGGVRTSHDVQNEVQMNTAGHLTLESEPPRGLPSLARPWKHQREWEVDIATRLSCLEQKLDSLQPSQCPVIQNEQRYSASLLSQPRVAYLEALPGPCSWCRSEESRQAKDAESSFRSGTDLLTPISVLDRTLGSGSKPQTVPTASTPESSTESLADSAGCTYCQDIFWLSNQSLDCEDAETVRMHIRTYFTCLNTHYPLLDEAWFLAALDEYLNGVPSNPKSTESTESIGFLALVYFIIAVAKVLDEDWPVSTNVSGMKDFLKADKLLESSIWSGKVGLMTIQSLVVKTLFLIFSDRTSMAATAIALAVRLGYQLGIYDQKSWKTDDPTAVTSRQRIFWSLFCLDKHVALVSGMPYLIHASEFRVDLPLDFENQESPGNTRFGSTSLYFRSTIKWAKLSAEIWDGVFAINASKSLDPEFLAAMDARVELLIQDLPSQLRWNFDKSSFTDMEAYPRHVYRQCMIINLRSNHLRLLLRRQEMISLEYRDRTAVSCAEFAASSISAIHVFHTSQLYRNTDRYSSVVFLASSIIPLVCIIIQETRASELRQNAEISVQKALEVLKDISRTLPFANRVLQILCRLIGQTNDAIATSSLTDLDGLLLLDPGFLDGDYDMNKIDLFGFEEYQFPLGDGQRQEYFCERGA